MSKSFISFLARTSYFLVGNIENIFRNAVFRQAGGSFVKTDDRVPVSISAGEIQSADQPEIFFLAETGNLQNAERLLFKAPAVRGDLVPCSAQREKVIGADIDHDCIFAVRGDQREDAASLPAD